MITILPCPFCGKKASLEDEDTLYPSGTGWRDDQGFRTYHRYNEVPKEQWCWDMHCPTNAGGCGAQISGDSKEEAIAAWNRRSTAYRCECGWEGNDLEPETCVCPKCGHWQAVYERSPC